MPNSPIPLRPTNEHTIPYISLSPISLPYPLIFSCTPCWALVAGSLASATSSLLPPTSLRRPSPGPHRYAGLPPPARLRKQPLAPHRHTGLPPLLAHAAKNLSMSPPLQSRLLPRARHSSSPASPVTPSTPARPHLHRRSSLAPGLTTPPPFSRTFGLACACSFT